MCRRLTSLITVLLLGAHAAFCVPLAEAASAENPQIGSQEIGPSNEAELPAGSNRIFLPLDSAANSTDLKDGGQLTREQNFLQMENLVTHLALDMIEEFSSGLEHQKKLALLSQPIQKINEIVSDLLRVHHTGSYQLYDYIEKNYVMGPVIFAYMIARYVVVTTYFVSLGYTWEYLIPVWIGMMGTPDPEILAGSMIWFSLNYKKYRILREYKMNEQQIQKAQAEILDFQHVHRSLWHRVRIGDYVYVFPIAKEISFPLTLKSPKFWGRTLQVSELEERLNPAEVRALKNMSVDPFNYQALLVQKVLESEHRDWFVSRISVLSRYHNPVFAYLKSQQSEIKSDMRILSVNPFKLASSLFVKRQRELRQLRKQLREISNELDTLELQWTKNWIESSWEPSDSEFAVLQDLSQKRLKILLEIKQKSKKSHLPLFKLVEIFQFNRSCEFQF